jgi:hypothetical protein
LKATVDPRASKVNNAEKVKVTKLLHALVLSIHARANVYHWKIIGDSPECLSELLGCSHLVMCHILSMCDLYDTEKCSYRSGVDDNWKIFEPCQLIPSHLKHYDSSIKKTRVSKQWFLRIGEKPGRMKGPLQQYCLTGDNKKYHKLSYAPNKGRSKNEDEIHQPKLHRDELSMVKQLIELATKSMKIKDSKCHKPNTRSSQHNNSRKGDQLVTEQAKNSVAGQALLSQIMKELDAFITMDGKVCHDRLLLVSKFLHYSSKTLNGTIASKNESIETPAVSPSTKTSLASPATETETDTQLDNDATPQSFLDDETKDNKDKLVGILKEVLCHLTVEKSRTVEIEAWGGPKQIVAFPSRTRSAEAFVRQAKRTRWVDKLFPDNSARKGMLEYLADQHKPEFNEVAAEKCNLKSLQKMDTISTEAMARHCKLTGTQLKEVRGYVQTEAGLTLQHNATELEQLGKGPVQHFGTFDYFGVGKLVDRCKYWTTNCGEELEHALQHYYCEMVENNLQANTPLSCLPCVDYDLPGDSSRGITCIAGGDHGDVAFRFHWLFQFTSPEYRKKRRDISYGCPIVQVGFVECKKDKFEVMEKTIMKRIDEERLRMVGSGVVVIYPLADLKQNQCFLVPKEIDMSQTRIQMSADGAGKQLTYRCLPGKCKQPQECHDGLTHMRELPPIFHDHHISSLRVTRSISMISDRYVGDLEWVANNIGMLNCGGRHCHLCDKSAVDFGTGKGNDRTKETIQSCYREYLLKVERARQRGSSKKPQAVGGVSIYPLLDVDPQKIILPTLHCEIGLLNKYNESFEAWVQLRVEGLPPEAHEVREAYTEALKKEDECNATRKHTPTAVTERTYQAAKKERQAAFKLYEANIKVIGKREGGFSDLQEDVFRNIGMKHEAYFAGKLNGKSVRQQMENAKKYSDAIQEVVLSVHDTSQSNVTEEQIIEACEKYANLLGCLDALFSHIRGVDEGLLPTEEQIEALERIVEQTRKLWIGCGLTTLQPKWHLIFDGHLIDQVRREGGLADKNDDAIEKAHQPWKREKERTWNIQNFEEQQRSQLKSVRKRNHYKINGRMAEVSNKRKRLFKSNSHAEKLDAAKANEREEKVVKRQAYIEKD